MKQKRDKENGANKGEWPVRDESGDDAKACD